MTLHAPQLIVGARMLYLVWLPEDPTAAAALVPDELQAAPESPVFMNQYVVDDAGQTSKAASDEGFGAYARRVSRPYAEAVARHFSADAPTLTERGLDRLRLPRRGE